MIACFEYYNLLLLFMERKHIYLANNNANKRCQHKICVCICHYEFVYRKLSYALPYIFRQICPSLPNRHHSFSLLLHVFFSFDKLLYLPSYFHILSFFVEYSRNVEIIIISFPQTFSFVRHIFPQNYIKVIRNRTYFF